MCKWKKRICFLFHNILVGFILQFSTLYFYIRTLSVWIWTFVPRAGLGILHKLIFVLKVLIMEMEFGAVCVFLQQTCLISEMRQEGLPTYKHLHFFILALQLKESKFVFDEENCIVWFFTFFLSFSKKPFFIFVYLYKMKCETITVSFVSSFLFGEHAQSIVIYLSEAFLFSR